MLQFGWNRRNRRCRPAGSASGLAPRFLLLLFVGLTPSLQAQDSHYWTYQYGPRAGLLGGAVIGSVDDIGASFYNPGGLALADSLGFAFGLDVFQLESLKLENAAGVGIDLSDQTSGFVPSIIAGTITTRFLGDNLLTYSLLTRQRDRNDSKARFILGPEGSGSGGGISDLFINLRSESSFTEIWGGLSWARKLSPTFGIGGTWYVAYRDQRRTTTVSAEALEGAGGLVDISFRDFDYNNIRTLWKGGLFAKSGSVSAGLTVTTPSLKISGGGDAAVNRFSIIGSADPGQVTADLSTSLQSGLGASYKTPLSIGLGGAWAFTGRSRVHASAEWYDAVGSYDAIETEDFTSQSSQETVPFDILDERRSVWNFAVGVEHEFNSTLKAYGSVFTDKSSHPGRPGATDLSVSNWDVRVLTIGADLAIFGRHLTIGIGYGKGSSESDQLADIVLANQGLIIQAQEGLIGAPGETEFEYQVIRLIFGFRS